VATTDFGHAPRRLAEGAPSPALDPAPRESPPSGDQQRAGQVRSAETRLLYENASTGIAVALGIASILAYAVWDTVPRSTVIGWLLYMLAVSFVRVAISRRYWREAANAPDTDRGRTAFVAGTGLAAAGWASSAVALSPPGPPLNEILVVFVIGGVMLGSASLLAARPEAFLTFLLPTGIITSLRLISRGDGEHLIMGVLGAMFTVATVITTWRFHLAIASSFKLRFANQALIESLQRAKDDADALNRDLERRVSDRTARLLEADQRKDEFLATLAHELRNPLAPIRFALDAMTTDPLPATATRARDVIERQVRQLVRLVDDLLDVSRITADKIQLRSEPVDVGRMLMVAVESTAPLAAAAEQTLDVQVSANSTPVHGDAARLVQVFANVLNNAVKFTPRGGHIRVTAGPEAGEAVVRIRDSGVGIAKDVLPRVFDMFQQAEPVLERSTGGLGIGLTLARRLVEMHDGKIAVGSPGVGQGTEVEIRFPLTAADIEATTPAEPSQVAQRILRVLIVEDNVDAAEMLQLAVSQLGHLTAVAHDGGSALTAAAAFRPDVIFLDIGLPVMNGYAVASALRVKPEFRNVHIAAVTGWGQDEDRRKAREAGCDSHFTKPLSPAALGEMLSKIANAQAVGPGADGTPRTRHADSGGTLRSPV
jgi:signal transduction histidine kinase/ActR/RegA family two-component response regulator